VRPRRHCVVAVRHRRSRQRGRPVQHEADAQQQAQQQRERRHAGIEASEPRRPAACRP
jgi:hypothetical protein